MQRVHIFLENLEPLSVTKTSLSITATPAYMKTILLEAAIVPEVPATRS